MAYISPENKKKTKRIVEDVREFITLTGNPDPTTKAQVGLCFDADAENLSVRCKDLEEGVFKTLVMGKFKNGKSTFINAIVGKLMMAAKASACTAVIATVELGPDTNSVTVFYSNKAPEKMSLQQFTERFQLSQAEQDKIMEEGKLDRFSNVDHVEMQSRDELFADGVKLIDSPGLEEGYARTKATYNYVPKANAIIFTLSAISLFSAEEKSYIAEHFVGKYPRNVFFVVNRVDNLNAGQLDESVKPTVRAGLEAVFTDKNGHFDEALYNSRVFFTSAYPALCAKTGMPYKVMVGPGEVELPFPLEQTGLPEFEAALKEFLNSDERIRASYSSTLTQLSDIYQKAEKKAATDIAARSQSTEERKKNLAAAKKKLDDAQKDVEDIRKKARRAASLIAEKIYVDLSNYAGKTVADEFAVLVEDGAMQQKFGVGSLLTLAATFAASKLPFSALKDWAADTQKDLMSPFVSAINGYIRTKMQDEWPKRIPALTHQDCVDLMDDIKQEAEEFSLNLDEAINLFAYGHAKAPGVREGGAVKATVQSIIAALNLDFSTMIDATGAGLNWGDFLKEVVIQLVVMDTVVNIVVGILGGPFFWPAIIATELFQMKRHSNRTGKQLLVAIANAGFASLSDEIAENEMAIKEKIVNQIIERCEDAALVAERNVKEQLANMNKIVAENDRDKAAAEAEKVRLTTIRDKMKELIEDVYAILYGHAPTAAEFAALGRNTSAG